MSRRWVVIAVPMLWLGIFFLLPFLEVARISLLDPAIAQPPVWADSLNFCVSLPFSLEKVCCAARKSAELNSFSA